MPDDTERPQVKPAAAWLQEQRGGSLHGELSEALAEVTRLVGEREKQGKITLTVTIKPNEGVSGAVLVEDKLAVKPPELTVRPSLFFADADGNLSRRNPNQPELPLRDASAPAEDHDDEPTDDRKAV